LIFIFNSLMLDGKTELEEVELRMSFKWRAGWGIRNANWHRQRRVNRFDERNCLDRKSMRWFQNRGFWRNWMGDVTVVWWNLSSISHWKLWRIVGIWLNNSMCEIQFWKIIDVIQLWSWSTEFMIPSQNADSSFCLLSKVLIYLTSHQSGGAALSTKLHCWWITSDQDGCDRGERRIMDTYSRKMVKNDLSLHFRLVHQLLDTQCCFVLPNCSIADRVSHCFAAWRS
jgi:hypothetical protein